MKDEILQLHPSFSLGGYSSPPCSLSSRKPSDNPTKIRVDARNAVLKISPAIVLFLLVNREWDNRILWNLKPLI
jgi:hypothetical protein